LVTGCAGTVPRTRRSKLPCSQRPLSLLWGATLPARNRQDPSWDARRVPEGY